MKSQSGSKPSRDLGKRSEWTFLSPLPRPDEHPHLWRVQVLVNPLNLTLLLHTFTYPHMWGVQVFLIPWLSNFYLHTFTHPRLRGMQVLVIDPLTSQLWKQFPRRPIEERVVTALGKHWHIEHFACAKCEKPFLGNRHYERKGLAYCATHYHQVSFLWLFGPSWLLALFVALALSVTHATMTKYTFSHPWHHPCQMSKRSDTRKQNQRAFGNIFHKRLTLYGQICLPILVVAGIYYPQTTDVWPQIFT